MKYIKKATGFMGILGIWVYVIIFFFICKELIEVDRQNVRLEFELAELLKINADLKSENDRLKKQLHKNQDQ